MNHKDIYFKNQTHQEWQNYLIKFLESHHIFSITYTFNNSFIVLDPKEALQRFYMGLSSAAVSRPSTRNLKPILLCFSEDSGLCKAATMVKNPHFHCFFIMPKIYEERFGKKAIVDIKRIYNERAGKSVPVVELRPKLYHASAGLDIYSQQLLAQAYDVRAELLLEPSDVTRSYSYATKTTVAYRNVVSLKEIDDWEKTQPKAKTFTLINEDENKFLMFC